MAEITTVPAKVLRTPTNLVKNLDKKVSIIVDDMIRTLKTTKKPEGVGLAAPQIGIPLSIFLIRPNPKKAITVFINPQITKYSQRLQSPHKDDGVYEGCLSIPGHYGPVTRSMSVTVKYKNEKFEDQTNTFSGFSAHVIQHEMDHLNGILFIDRILEQNNKLYRVKGKEWVEVGL